MTDGDEVHDTLLRALLCCTALEIVDLSWAELNPAAVQRLLLGLPRLQKLETAGLQTLPQGAPFTSESTNAGTIIFQSMHTE